MLETQRSQVTCSRSHSSSVRNLSLCSDHHAAGCDPSHCLENTSYSIRGGDSQARTVGPQGPSLISCNRHGLAGFCCPLAGRPQSPCLSPSPLSVAKPQFPPRHNLTPRLGRFSDVMQDSTWLRTCEPQAAPVTTAVIGLSCPQPTHLCPSRSPTGAYGVLAPPRVCGRHPGRAREEHSSDARG